MLVAAVKLCHAASPAPQPFPELLRATPRCPLLCPDGHRDVPRECCPWEGQEGVPCPCHGQAGHRSTAGDAEMLWQSPWQPQYTASRTKLPAEKQRREEKRKVGKGWKEKKSRKGKKPRSKNGAGESHGEGNQLGWRVEAAPLGMSFTQPPSECTTGTAPDCPSRGSLQDRACPLPVGLGQEGTVPETPEEPGAAQGPWGMEG